MGVIETLRSVLRFRPLQLDPVERRLARAASIDDLREIAKHRLPGGVFDYIDGAAEGEHTLAANRGDFAAIRFRPRVLRDMSDVDTSTTLFGRTLPIPLALAPTGFARIADPAGELAVARAAARKGFPYTLSTLGTRSIEEVAAVSDGPKWFQLYFWRDRGRVKDLIDRATQAGYEALMLTVDTPVFGKRERDVRRGFELPPRIGLGTLIDGALHPGWTWAFVRSEPIRFANVDTGEGDGDGGTAAVELAAYVNSQGDPSLSWDDIDWTRSFWKGPILVKGIQTVADARIAVDVGVDAIVLSNHGGRQLDTSPSPISLVEPVAQEVAGAVPVLCDGGVRRGSDIVKAVARGATACLAGRAHFYALGAGGERGVDHALDLLTADVRRTMALVGARTVPEIARELVD